MADIISRPYDKNGEETWDRIFGNDKKELSPYEQLIERVKKIDTDAAKYLETGARELTSFLAYHTLEGCMSWVDTPQGHSYWGKIYLQLKQAKK